jgi:hypothetical protein
VASFTASSAARFNTLRPSSAKELRPMLLNPASTFQFFRKKNLYCFILVKPSVAVSLVTCFEIPFKASFNPPEILRSPVPSVCGTDSSPAASQRNQKENTIVKIKNFFMFVVILFSFHKLKSKYYLFKYKTNCFGA